MSESRLVCLYGGTFDPVHVGHVAVAAAAREALAVQSVVFIPAHDPPLRTAPGANAADRLAMLELALKGRADMSIDTSEVERVGASYTVLTLQLWRAKTGARQPLVWLIGADAFRKLERWQRWQELFELAHFAVVERAGSTALTAASPRLQREIDQRLVASAEALHARPAGSVLPVGGPRHAASATNVRARCAAGESAADLLAPEVWAYIKRRRLYGWRAEFSQDI